MVSWTAVTAVSLIALVMVVTPGPNMMYLVSRSVSQGRGAGLVSLGGVVVGLSLYVVATALGLSVLFATVPVLFTVVKILGAAYLLHLAWGILRGGRRISGTGELSGHSPRRLFAMGLTTCLLNPKVALMYAALLPQFVDPDRGSPALQLMVLGLVQVTVAGTVNAMWVLLAASLARLLESSTAAERLVRWLTGTLLGGFAVHLGLSRPGHA